MKKKLNKKFIQAIQTARENIKKGNFYTESEAKKIIFDY